VQRCTFAVKLKPRAKSDRISGTLEDVLLVAVTAPPIDNRANAHCIALLAKRLRCPKSSLHIIKGEHSRNKVIACDGLSEDAVHERLAAL
jgi:uncharacterized protein (TIGR00251 family)